MNVKIQGSGNGTYANTGSCVAVTNYLQHEDLERMKKGEEVQPFFNQFRDYVSAREVTFKIDNNKAKLSHFAVLADEFLHKAFSAWCAAVTCYVNTAILVDADRVGENLV